MWLLWIKQFVCQRISRVPHEIVVTRLFYHVLLKISNRKESNLDYNEITSEIAPFLNAFKFHLLRLFSYIVGLYHCIWFFCKDCKKITYSLSTKKRKAINPVDNKSFCNTLPIQLIRLIRDRKRIFS